MKLIILHRQIDSTPDYDKSLPGSALADEPLGQIVVEGLSRSLNWCGKGKAICAIPDEQAIGPRSDSGESLIYGNNIPIHPDMLGKPATGDWHVISNGRFASHIGARLLEGILSDVKADIIAITLQPTLGASQERMRLTPDGRIAGLRRVYEDSAELSPLPSDWPHHLFVRDGILSRILKDGNLPESWPILIETCRANALTFRALNVGGAITDLATHDGLLSFVTGIISDMPRSDFRRLTSGRDVKSSCVPESTRLLGKVLLGRNVDIGEGAVIVGPALIGDNVTIGAGTIVKASVIGSGTKLSQDQIIQDSILPAQKESEPPEPTQDEKSRPAHLGGPIHGHRRPVFRQWPRLSYAHCFKRIADVLFASAVLLLFIPLTPFIGLAIKINSPGPMFFKHKREGLRGKPFDCLKFRSMHVGSDEMQDKLRKISQVDGPQFKMEDDPRISKVGIFLRETYIDEIPQFLNVLLGHMSIIGPRPSPRKENTQCPYWRDARLSVRPGITGLWQVSRTREPMHDFQEWIYYDLQYVKNLSLRMDLSIFWKTFTKLVDDFIRQF